MTTVQPSRPILSSFSPGRLLAAHASALALQKPGVLSPAENLLLTLVHAAGMLALARYFQSSLALALALAVGLVAVLLGLSRAQRIGPTWFAPLFLVYAVLLSRLVYLRLMHGTIYGYYDYNPPEWGLLLLHVEAITVAALLYSVAILACNLLHSRRRIALIATCVLLLASTAWAGYKYFSQRTAGATGSDPYAYVQMGVDIAEHGTPAHRFALFPAIAETQLPWYPLLHVGYHLPMNMQGDAVTVWPPAGSLAYAAAWKLTGEEGVYWVNPLFFLLSGLAAGWLAWELLQRETIQLKGLVAAGSAALVVTASVQVVWAGVTMADAQTELLSAVAFALALYAVRRDSSVWPLLAGAALGAAYDIRHTQLILAPVFMLLYGFGSSAWRQRLKASLLSGLAALCVAFPDLWYHELYLGGWLHPESEELALYSLNAIGDTANNLYQTAFAANEFGWFLPLLLYGIARMAKRVPLEFAALALWLGLALALHLPYPALRLRDLLPELPVAALFVCYGVADLTQSIVRARRMLVQLAGGLALIVVLELGLLRVWNTVPSAWQVTQPIFGYMTTSERAAFNQLAAVTPPGAVIGATLNSGAIELYAHRESFRPADWQDTERERFLQIVLEHSPVYVLEDSRELDGPLDEMRGRYQVSQVAKLDVPLFGDGTPLAPGTLWKIESGR